MTLTRIASGLSLGWLLLSAPAAATEHGQLIADAMRLADRLEPTLGLNAPNAAFRVLLIDGDRERL